MLDLFTFVLEDPLRMAPPTETCRSFILLMSCILFRAFVVWRIDCKNLRVMSNVKFVLENSSTFFFELDVSLGLLLAAWT